MRLGQWEKALRETEDSLRLEPSVVVEHSNLVPYRFVAGQLQRSRKLFATRGLNEDHNHELKNIFKGAATTASARPGPFHDFYAALLAKGMRPSMARLTLARKIAAIVAALRAEDLWEHVLVEVSGRISEAAMEAHASSGVDAISVGALTHSCRALDLRATMEPRPE